LRGADRKRAVESHEKGRKRAGNKQKKVHMFQKKKWAGKGKEIGLRVAGRKRAVSHERGRKWARKRAGKEQEKGRKEAQKGRNGHERGT
jgi:hypothetical protein